jgi:acetyl esterase
VFYHGGGFIFGSIETHDRLCRLICRGAGIHVLSVGYRLAPEHPAPAGLQDAHAAFLWATTHAADLGAEPGAVCVGGDSAGANFAAVVAHRARDAGAPPRLQLLLYPATDLRGATASRNAFAEGFLLTRKDIDLMQRHYLSNSGIEVTDAEISPLLSDDFTGLPPTIVVTAGFDPLRDEGEAYAAALAAAGTVVDLRRFGSMVHGFAQLDALGGGCATAMADIISALRAHLRYR